MNIIKANFFKIIYRFIIKCYNSIKRKNLEGKSVPYSIFDIANWFLHKGTMEHKKLQKLCYYAQSWYLVFNNNFLVRDSFEAWVHGPVNRNLWNQLREFGYYDIPADQLVSLASCSIDQSTASLLESVWKTYGELSGYQLECLSHREEPWIEARRGLEDLQPSTNLINPVTMQNYYYSLISNNGVGE